MDIKATYKSLIRDDGLTSIKATWVEKFVLSPISFWCDLYAPPENHDPLDPYRQYLFEVGQSHQSMVIENSCKEAVQQTFSDEEEGFRLTLELMAKGERGIMNMPLLSRPVGLEGRPDLLLRVDGIDSALGHFSYEVIEIKSARNIGEAHILQGAVYNRLLGLIQEYEPTKFHIVNNTTPPKPAYASLPIRR